MKVRFAQAFWFSLLLVMLATVAIMSGCGRGFTGTTPTPTGTTATTGTTTGGTTGGTTTGGTGTGGTGTTTGGTTGGGTTGGGTSSPVQSTTPAAGATCVPQFSDITVKFNPGMAPPSVTNANFTVQGPDEVVPGRVTFDASQNTATFTLSDNPNPQQPGEPLGAITTYTANISGFSDGSRFSWSFKTGPCGEIIPAYAATYTTIQVPGSTATRPFGINSSGVVVGEYQSGNATHGFKLEHGTYTTIDFPGANGFTRAWKVSNTGDIVGIYSSSTGGHGFLLQNGTFTSIDFPDAGVFATEAQGINSAGTIVGRANFTTGSAHGFIRDPNGSYRLFDAPNSSGGDFATDINERGDITGVVGGNTKGYLFSAGTFNDIIVPNVANTEAYGVNNADSVVGLWAGAKVRKPVSGFLKSGSSYFDLVVPDSTFVQGNDVNDTGVVVGIWSMRGQDHGFIAKPTTVGGSSVQDLIYALNNGSSNISGYIFNSSGNSTSSASGSPTSTDGLGPYFLTASLDGKYLFATIDFQLTGVRGSNCNGSQSEVMSFSIDRSTGALTPVHSLKLNGSCAGRPTLNPAGTMLYVPTHGSATPANIEALVVDTAGHLSQLPGSPFAAGSEPANELVMAPDGRHLYGSVNFAGFNAGIFIYSRDTATGTVQFQSAVNVGGQAGIAISPSGNTVLSTDFNNTALNVFVVDASNGNLTSTQSVPLSGFVGRALIDPSGRFGAAVTSGGVYMFTISSSGSVSMVTGSPFGGSTNAAVFDSSGQYLSMINPFVADSSTGTVSVYRVELSGSLTPVATGMQTQQFPKDIAMPTK